MKQYGSGYSKVANYDENVETNRWGRKVVWWRLWWWWEALIVEGWSAEWLCVCVTSNFAALRARQKVRVGHYILSHFLR